MKRLKAFVFDAYGTLFDVHSVAVAADRRFLGHGSELSTGWRKRQLEYTWLRSLMGRYEDFWRVTEEALIATCKALRLALDADAREELMEAYLRLATFPEVKSALGSLSGTQLAILSNGAPEMLDQVVENAGLEGIFAHLISVDEVRVYKPSPATYHLVIRKLGVEKDEIGFVSSNFFDVAGAKTFGFKTFWLNRSDNTAEELGVMPNATIKSLTDLVAAAKI